MASTATLSTLYDGPRNVARKVLIDLDAAGNIALATFLDPATLTPIPESLRINKIVYSGPANSDTAIRFWWEATANVPIYTISNGDDACFDDIGGLCPPNPRPAGFTGKILYETVGGADIGTAVHLVFSAVVECVKKGIPRN